MKNLPRILGPLALAACLGGALAGATGCARGEIHRLVVAPPERQTTGDPELFATGPPRTGKEVAVVSSIPRTGLDDATMARHVREVRNAARRAGADAVVNLRLLTVKKHGYVRDPAPPFPGAKQDDYATYIMRGTAIVYIPEPEEVAVAAEAAAAVDATGAEVPDVERATP